MVLTWIMARIWWSVNMLLVLVMLVLIILMMVLVIRTAWIVVKPLTASLVVLREFVGIAVLSRDFVCVE